MGALLLAPVASAEPTDWLANVVADLEGSGGGGGDPVQETLGAATLLLPPFCYREHGVTVNTRPYCPTAGVSIGIGPIHVGVEPDEMVGRDCLDDLESDCLGRIEVDPDL